MEDKSDEVDELETASSDSFINDMDVDEPLSPRQDDGVNDEAPLTDEEIEGLIAELLEVESKAAEAQESLEDEALARVEVDVREELAQSYNGDELEKAVTEEMEALKEEWEAVLDELETECADLLEQLDGAGVELPSLYKWIESQAPNGCSTEAWKKRTHWVGSQVTNDITESIADAEKYLQIHRPVRKKLGKVLEEGASGFLCKKLSIDRKEALVESSDVDWSSLNKIFSSSADCTSFGSNHWASVYLASTPQQAAQLGIKFPGVDEVEEIDDLEGSSNFLVPDAIVHEEDTNLSEAQKKNFRKVKEEDDVEIDRILQLRLKRRRQRNRLKTEALKDVSSVDRLMEVNKDDSEATDSVFIEDTVGPVDNKIDSTCKNSQNVNGGFCCTACHKMAAEVHPHPLLGVIICGVCKLLIESKILMQDPDCSESYCRWCGRNISLISCKSCTKLFCTNCISTNLGEKCLFEVQASGWKCCCCTPSILQRLTSECEGAIMPRVVIVSSSDSDEDGNVLISTRKRQKKRIRRIIDDTELGEVTKQKIAMEKERQDRLESLKAQFSTNSVGTISSGFTAQISEGCAAEVLGDASTGYIVNVVREEREEAVRIPPSISSKLKSHQVLGIRFMWENIIQSIRKVKSGDKGLGCILAHTMGLGKTFQVITFLYCAMRSVDLGLKNALIVTPVNVLHNWRREFVKWKPSELEPIRVFMLEDVSREKRAELLMKWKRKGGVFLIGYTSFRNLSVGKHVKDRNMARDILLALQEGPDILVCDEAHMIKNTRADTTQALKQVKCQRRIALTGSPLQNNLMEYYCMVDFVREGFLGSSHEFRNRFQNPIENGQHTNSTPNDVKIMNQRSHILYEQLKGFVQRMDMNVVKNDLPPKTVLVIAVKLSPLQRKLYKRFLDVHGFTKDKISTEKSQKSFFAGYQALAQIWNHPGILQLLQENKDYEKREEAVESFLADDSSSDENIDHITNGEKLKNRNDDMQRRNGNCFFSENWWGDLLHRNNYKEVKFSGKMILLLDILSLSSTVGDKVLIFSQSLATLDLIELYLSKLPRLGKERKHWKKGKDWYRLDGRTQGSERQRLVDRFNESSNTRVKCTLISTRAGSLGINLQAANRVIIVDGSWNPTHDLQAIYRVWRYGQTKPVFAYRLMAHGTMEEKIYKRQVTKESLSARVVDRQQVHRTISREEMLHLFDFGDDENSDDLKELGKADKHVTISKTCCSDESSLKKTLSIPYKSFTADKLMESLLSSHYPSWIANYHEHETLLQENEDERLSKEEQDMAWELYRRSFEWEEVPRVPVNGSVIERKPTLPVQFNEVVEQNSAVSDIPIHVPKSGNARQAQRVSRNRTILQNCTALGHMLTLRSQGTKRGCSTICGGCAQEISWD